jgi:hypothetical protein
MAVKDMTLVKGELNKMTKYSFEAATTATDGFKFKLPKTSDEYVIVLVQNTDTSASYKIAVKAPTEPSYYGSSSDEEITLAKGENAIFRFESAKWANRDGTITLIPENVAVKAVVLY